MALLSRGQPCVVERSAVHEDPLTDPQSFSSRVSSAFLNLLQLLIVSRSHGFCGCTARNELLVGDGRFEVSDIDSKRRLR